MKRLVFLALFAVFAGMATANTVPSSTMHFQGVLTDDGDGTFSGVLAMIDEGGLDSGYDVYGKEGATAYYSNDPNQLIGNDHDAWPTWTPDTPDWYQYSIEFYDDVGVEKWALRNHAGATALNPWSSNPGAYPARGVPMLGLMDWNLLYADETGTGAYLPAMGVPLNPGWAALNGGGAQAWDMDWSWGSEVVPLQYPGFKVYMQPLGGGEYHVWLVPEPRPITGTSVGVGIGVGIDVDSTCPEVLDEPTYFVDTETDLESTVFDAALLAGWGGRSYAFEGEQVIINVTVLDKEGFEGCTKVEGIIRDDFGYYTEVGCTRLSRINWTDPATNSTYPNALGKFQCIYTVEPAENTQGEYFVSVKAYKTCDETCEHIVPGVVSLWLNPDVSLTLDSQQQWGLMYSEGGTLLPAIYAGDTIYSPFFTVENTADSQTGLYILLMLYGEDMWDYGNSAALCPTSNILTIDRVKYRASHGDVQQPYTSMPRFAQNADYVFDTLGGNFLGIGDDVTMRLKLTIPVPCTGSFNDGGEIVFMGKVI